MSHDDRPASLSPMRRLNVGDLRVVETPLIPTGAAEVIRRQGFTRQSLHENRPARTAPHVATGTRLGFHGPDEEPGLAWRET